MGGGGLRAKMEHYDVYSGEKKHGIGIFTGPFLFRSCSTGFVLTSNNDEESHPEIFHFVEFFVSFRIKQSSVSPRLHGKG